MAHEDEENEGASRTAQATPPKPRTPRAPRGAKQTRVIYVRATEELHAAVEELTTRHNVSTNYFLTRAAWQLVELDRLLHTAVSLDGLFRKQLDEIIERAKRAAARTTTQPRGANDGQ